MKKVLLALLFAPLGVMAQSGSGNVPALAPEADIPVKVTPNSINDKVLPNTPVRVNEPTTRRSMGKAGYDLQEEQIGLTTYDLQTNNAMGRRVRLYSNGEVSVVWTSSSSTNQSFPDRGTAYNHYNGTSWSGQNSVRIEPERAGWPNITWYDSSGVTKEIIVSHHADVATSGGTFWMANDQIGSSDFDLLQRVDMPDGPYWPRIASTGDHIHMIAVYNSESPNYIYENGVRNPIVYYRYDVNTGQFDVKAEPLPGYDSTMIGQGTADVYDIDARDSIVAVLIGGPVSHLMMFKSTDYGQTWNKTIVDTFAEAPYDFFKDKTFDTTWSNDGTGSLVVDLNGNVHVFYPRMRVRNETSGDTSYSYFPGTNGIFHWDDNNTVKQIIGGVIDGDNSGGLDIVGGTTDREAGGYGSALATMPQASVDADNNIYMVYSAPVEDDLVDLINKQLQTVPVNARDIYVVSSIDGGATWDLPQNLTSGMGFGLEDVFAHVARDADDNLHMMWMQDDFPGIFLVNDIEINQNKIMYASIPTQDILDRKIENPEVGIAEPQVISTIGLYPNPADNAVTLALDLKNAANVSVRMVDVVGKTIMENNYGSLQSGQNMLPVDISNVKAGVYLVQVVAGGEVSTSRLVVE